MNHLNTLAAALILAALANGGCKSSSTGDAAAPAERKSQELVRGEPIPEGHPWAKLTYGMGTSEVRDLVGSPNDEGANVTGKTFNPFYYGTDTHHATWYYKNTGRLTFNSHGRLIEVRYNPDERGYR